MIPGAGQRKLAVGREDDVRDEVSVTVKRLLRDTVAGLIPSQSPDYQRLVCNHTTNTTYHSEQLLRNSWFAHQKISMVLAHLSKSNSRTFQVFKDHTKDIYGELN